MFGSTSSSRSVSPDTAIPKSHRTRDFERI
jgi:hypothetical protein